MGLYPVVLATVVLNQNPPDAASALRLVSTGVLILAAATVPLLATLIRPRVYAAALLVAWPIAFLSDNLRNLGDPMNAPAALAAMTAASVALAFYLTRTPDEQPSAGEPSA